MGSPAVVVGETISGFRIVRELKSRVTPTYVARRDAGPTPELVILQRFQSGDRASVLLRCAAEVRHHNVVEITSYDVASDEVVVVTDFVEGETLSQLFARPTGPPADAPLELVLRLLCDVLDGLHALHEAKDSTGRALRLVHGQLSREEILVGLDGVARITSVARGNVRRDARYIGYLAPEALLAEESPDARADLYSVGVLLWETLAKKRLFDGANVGQVLSQQMNATIPRPVIPQDILWAAPLVEIALKALSPDRKNRFSTALEMREEIEFAARGKIGEAAALGALVESLAGTRVRERKKQLLAHEPRSPSSSAVRRQARPMKVEDKTDDDATIADADGAPVTAALPSTDPVPSTDPDPSDSEDTGEIPTGVLAKSRTVRKSRPSPTEVEDDDEPRTIEKRPSPSQPAVTLASPQTEDEPDDETVTTKGPAAAEPSPYIDESVTELGAPLRAEKSGADYEDDSVTRRAPSVGSMPGADATNDADTAYLEDSATARKRRSDVGFDPELATDPDALHIDDDPEDDSITSQAPAAVTKLLRMVAAEVNQAQQLRRATMRPAAGAVPPPPVDGVIAQGLVSPAGPMPAARRTPSSRPMPTAPSSSPPPPVAPEDAYANLSALAPDQGAPPALWSAPPPAQFAIEPSEPTAPASRNDRVRVIAVVAFFVLSAIFCIVVVTRSLSSSSEASAAATEPPNAESPIVETLAPDPLARAPKPVPTASASASSSAAQKGKAPRWPRRR